MIDWSTWKATDEAVLCFIVEARGLLLIRKKRGLGAGKINAPGGKIEPGELPLAAAVRETEEEVRVHPLNLYQVGELFFHFVDGYNLHCHVFRADGCVGEPIETAEAMPFWVDPEFIPYDEMWQDDVRWLPFMLKRNNFFGRFVFDGDRMLSEEVRAVHEDFIQSNHPHLRKSSPWLVF